MLVVLAAATAAGAALRPAWAAPDTASLAEDPLLHEAAAWIDRLRQHGQTILPYPVSRLQRQFRLGYNRTCALVEALAQQGRWTIAYGSDGTRYAHIPA